MKRESPIFYYINNTFNKNIIDSVGGGLRTHERSMRQDLKSCGFDQTFLPPHK